MDLETYMKIDTYRLFHEEIKDGVDVVQSGYGYRYYIPCEICGEKILKTRYDKYRTYVCDYCKKLIKKKKEQAKIPSNLQDVETKREKQFKKAVERIKKQLPRAGKYLKAFEEAEKKAELYGSIPEAMVAIELIRLGYEITPQYKVGRFKTDFALLKQKVIVEVDGKIFHKEENEEREKYILQKLGNEWRILHVPAEAVAENITELKTYIRQFLQQG